MMLTVQLYSLNFLMGPLGVAREISMTSAAAKALKEMGLVFSDVGGIE